MSLLWLWMQPATWITSWMFKHGAVAWLETRLPWSAASNSMRNGMEQHQHAASLCATAAATARLMLLSQADDQQGYG